MTDRPRDDSGRYESGDVYSDDVFLDAIGDAETSTTVAVAEIVGCERTTAYDRLKQLEERDIVTSQNLGGVLVWRRSRGQS